MVKVMYKNLVEVEEDELQKVLKETVDDVFYGRKHLDMFSEGDKSKLMNLANEGDIHAACVLIKGMNRKEHSWMETFLDEETLSNN